MNLHAATQKLYDFLLRGKSDYKITRTYELLLNSLLCTSLLAVFAVGCVMAFDHNTANDKLISNFGGIVVATVLLWWLSCSGRHVAGAIASTICSLLALSNALLSSRYGMPSAEMIGIVILLTCAMLLELKLTRLELKAERDALEKRVIERTEQLEAEQLRRTLELQRFAEFGRLSAQLLHDVANPLTVASLYLDQAEHKSSQAIREARRSLKHLEQYVQSARNQLRDTSEARDFTIQHELKQLLLLLKPVAQKSGVRIVVCRSTPLQLHGDPVRFHQIMANVVANAIDACKKNDKSNNVVTIKIRYQARYAIITVHDTGHGIAPVDLPRIFEPFFTTKQNAGRGLGIGLATVKKTLRESYQGTICAQSTPEHGTTFTLLLRAEKPLLPQVTEQTMPGKNAAVAVSI